MIVLPSVGKVRMLEYRLEIYRQQKRYTPAGEEIPDHTETFHAPGDAAATDEACSRYDKFAAEQATQAKPKIADPRLDRGELYEGDRAVCAIWRPLRRSFL
jgi:hypothetical protein